MTPQRAWSFVALAAGVVLAASASAQDSVIPPPAVTPLPNATAPATAPSAAPVIPGVPAADVPPEEPTPAVAKPEKPDAVLATGNTVEADDDKPEPPPELEKRPRFASAVLQATDKITAETVRFEAKVGESLRYKGLIVTLRTCETTAGNEEPFDSIANVDVLSQPQGMAGGAPAPARSVYRGWMFASSPSLHAFEHPIYDLWLISCRTNAPVGAPAAPPPAPRRVATPKAAPKPVVSADGDDDSATVPAAKPAPKPAKPKAPTPDDATTSKT